MSFRQSSTLLEKLSNADFKKMYPHFRYYSPYKLDRALTEFVLVGPDAQSNLLSVSSPYVDTDDQISPVGIAGFMVDIDLSWLIF